MGRYPFMPSPSALPMKCPSSMISSAALICPYVCCVSLGMSYDDPACKSSAWIVVRGSLSISSWIARLIASPIVICPWSLFSRREAMCFFTVSIFSLEIVAALILSANSGPEILL